MLDRICEGEVPAKHHLALRREDGGLHHEECLTRRGFDGPYSILYHLEAPHLHMPGGTLCGWQTGRQERDAPLHKRHFRSGALPAQGGAPIHARVPMLQNSDVVISAMRPSKEDPFYFSNSDGDDLFFVLEGGGTLRSPFGDLRFEKHDYVCVPKGVVHRFILDESPQHWLSIECFGGLRLMDRWRTSTGQLRMDAPYCHRDFRRPTFQGPRDEGLRELLVKRGGRFHSFVLAGSPLGVVGWDGSVYPWVFPIMNFQARAGMVHLPPDWHGTFATRGALVCSFVPRSLDFHPEAVPCPYPHSSVDCDELLFYCTGDFGSRRGIGAGSLSLHPAGIPHGPHPGAYEASLGETRTEELAVMLDTFKPLQATCAAMEVEDRDYMRSFQPRGAAPAQPAW